jgi:hypothetical protein
MNDHVDDELTCGMASEFLCWSLERIAASGELDLSESIVASLEVQFDSDRHSLFRVQLAKAYGTLAAMYRAIGNGEKSTQLLYRIYDRAVNGPQPNPLPIIFIHCFPQAAAFIAGREDLSELLAVSKQCLTLLRLPAPSNELPGSLLSCISQCAIAFAALGASSHIDELTSYLIQLESDLPQEFVGQLRLSIAACYYLVIKVAVDCCDPNKASEAHRKLTLRFEDNNEPIAKIVALADAELLRLPNSR